MSDAIAWIIVGISMPLNVYLYFFYRPKRSDGQIVVKTDPETGNKVFSLELDKSPEEIETMGNISFKVNHKNGDSQ